MGIAITIISIIPIIWMTYIIYIQQNTIKELAKLIKSDNLQEYENLKWELHNQIKVWQEAERFKDISEISDEDLKDIHIDPSVIYWGFTWKNTKKETFNS